MSIQGFEPRGSLSGDLTSATFPFIVSNAVVVTAGNAVVLHAGYVENAIYAQSDVGILGVAVETVTGSAASATVAVLCDTNVVYYNDANGSVAQADVGKIYQIALSSGKMAINQSTGNANTAGDFVLIKKDPDGDKDASKGLFKIYKSQLYNRSDDT